MSIHCSPRRSPQRRAAHDAVSIDGVHALQRADIWRAHQGAAAAARHAPVAPVLHLPQSREDDRGQQGRGGWDQAERPFAFAFQPLFPDTSAFVEDGSHTLVVYRADKLMQLAPGKYLGAPSRLAAGQKPEQLLIPAELARHAQGHADDPHVAVLDEVHAEPDPVPAAPLGEAGERDACDAALQVHVRR